MSYSLPIETDRLTLRRYVEDDYDDLLKLQSNPDVTRFLLYDVRTPEQVKQALTGRLADVPMDTDGQALTAAVIRRDTGQHVGEVTLFVNNAEQRTGELGYVFHPESHGHGYAAEAAVELLRLGFEELGMHRIIARLDYRNTGSVKLLQRLGLREEAHFVRNEYLKGEWTDELVFAMLADEWNKRS
ncbi:GNAT family N-acetyltransferase [Kribbella solani]|uniref:RimJ/RimL family protein N-acetyltransferase n=1 Tax=Kribbella solani TaxID=236067 RepID=A0A841DVX3_9ACTN|nr:GNAT family N-acetyltransferase [Kribbella solani]MBB5980985.1 RimJ/RimL family protein N-acetyltransferase [Kribbella solani]MDX2970545.1 GNAT family N-acetyltransferase [Kribbella solani]MDX3003554.1 GNAT family N-acetyltransferase [Kribbella solani]